ncbi:hypothetical protein AAMO2058_000561200 [Amorphochlora amoebiformis]
MAGTQKVGVIGDTIAELTNSISHLRRTNEYLKAHKEFKTDLELREAVEENEDLIQRRLEQIKDLKEKMNPHKRALPESRKVVDKRSKVGMHENQGKVGGDKKNMDSDGDEKNKQVKGGFML